ncbi:sulfatase [Labilibacter marinus]|uniref:sulfatase n=1 Tax=Labilibacter marinus TaxID=1477105 RepID=UPI00083648DF|nr:sulfatase [Labilibacter marinus]
MKRNIFITLLLAIVVVVSAKKKQEQPNIVLLFVDDLGWADLGYRNTLFETPNIDQLSKEGSDFERAYIASPSCSPSRASILTGKEPVRFQMARHIVEGENKLASIEGDFNMWKKDPVQMPSINHLPLEEVTYAERLKEFGYYNMFIGKWHSGTEDYHPIHQGFDEQYGTGNHGHPKSYYPPFFAHGNPLEDIKEDYLTDVLTDKAVDFIETYKKKQPFMLSLWYYNVHGPHIGRKDLIGKYEAKGMDNRYANYGAMVEAMDESVGRVRSALKAKGISDNTVVIFTSDQGGYFTNYPLRGKKNGGYTLNEGGARIPFIVYYPGVSKPVKINTPIQTLDVYSTLVEIASGKDQKDPQVNGVSLMPLIKGDNIEDRDLYFHRSYEDQYAAVISGDWKLIKYHSGNVQLYNVVKDPGEVSNLVFVHPQKTKELKDRLAAWEKEAVPSY